MRTIKPKFGAGKDYNPDKWDSESVQGYLGTKIMNEGFSKIELKFAIIGLKGALRLAIMHIDHLEQRIEAMKNRKGVNP